MTNPDLNFFKASESLKIDPLSKFFPSKTFKDGQIPITEFMEVPQVRAKRKPSEKEQKLDRKSILQTFSIANHSPKIQKIKMKIDSQLIKSTYLHLYS